MSRADDLVILRTPRSRILADKIYSRFTELVQEHAKPSDLHPTYPDGLTPQLRSWAESLYQSLLLAFSRRTNGNNYLHDVNITVFPSKEIYPQISETVRRKNVYVVQTFNAEDDTVDPHTPLMELLLINRALKLASAEEVTNVLPYIPYQRQDRVDRARVPISAKLVADLIEVSGADRILTFDLHAEQGQGFFNIPVDHLRALQLFVKDFKGKPDYVAVAPDEGSLKRTRQYAEKTGLKVAMVEKKRNDEGVEFYFVIGEDVVRGRHAIEVDDQIDTGKTGCGGGKKLIEKGALSVREYGTHLVLSRDPKTNQRAEDRFREAGIQVVGTDSIPRSDRYLEQNRDWLEVRSVAPMLAEAIYRIQMGESLTGRDLLL